MIKGQPKPYKKGQKLRIKVKVKPTKAGGLPNWGLGAGIISQTDIIVGEDVTPGNQTVFLLYVYQTYRELLEKSFKPVIEEI